MITIDFLPITGEYVGQAADELIAGVVEGQVALYQRTGAEPPWIGYFAREGGALVGSCSFVGPPSDGTVEIAYFTFPHAEGRGIARTMAAWLVETARQTGAVSRIIAHTLPTENPSTRVLRSVGFHMSGSAMDDEVGPVWEWAISGHG